MADAGNNRIRAISPDGMVTTLAGSGERGFQDGPPDQAQFDGPFRLTVDGDRNVYVVDGVWMERRGNRVVCRIAPDGTVTTVVGTGRAGVADGAAVGGFRLLGDVAVDTVGNLYVADSINRRVRVITPQGSVYTLAGNATMGYADGPGAEAAFFWPDGIAEDGAGRLYVTEFFGNRIRVIRVPRSVEAAPLPPTPDPTAGQDVIKTGFVDELTVPGAIHAATMMGAQLAVDEANAAGGVMVGGTRYTFALVTVQDWNLPGANAQAAARMTYEELGIRRAVLLGEADPHVRTAVDAWQGAFESLGGQVLGHFEAEFQLSAKELAQLKTLAPEAVVFFPPRSLNPERAVQQVQETGVEAVIVGLECFTTSATFLAGLGDAAEGIYDAVTGPPRAGMPGYAGFAERYREASFTIVPDPDDFLAKWAPFGHDAAGVIIAAVRQAAEGGGVTRQSVATAMETFRHEPYKGITGIIQFDEYGDLLDQSVSFKKVVNGQWVDVMPGER